jgi:hypothetical protein
MGNKKGGGGGGSQQISPSKEYGEIFNIFQKRVVPGYRKFAAQERLLKPLTPLAEQGITELPGFQEQLTGAFERYTPTAELTGPLKETYANYITPILQSQGALTPELKRQATQEFAARSGMAGMANTAPSLFGEGLNREIYRQKRYGEAFNQALQLTSQIPSLEQADYARTLGYAQGMQGLRGTVMQDLAAAENARIGAFGQLFNPTAAGVGSAVGFNANAAAAQQNAQSQKKGNTTGAAIGAVGTVAAALL